jgi:hypothetical protein
MHIVAILYGVETHIERHTSTKHVIVIERSL